MAVFLVVSTFFVRQYVFQGQVSPGFCCEVRGNACTQKSRFECISVAGSWTPAGQDVCDVVLCNLGGGSPPANTSSSGGSNSSKPVTCGFHFSFNESGGSGIVDSSGNGVTGTLDPAFDRNCPAPAPTGPANTACIHQPANPGSTPPSVPLSSTVAPAGAFTFGEWIKPVSFPTAGPSQSGCPKTYNHLANDSSFQITIDSTGKISLPGAGLVASQPLTAGAWSHISYTWDGTAGTIYVNGVSVGSSTTPPAPTAATDAPMASCYSAGEMYIDESFSYPSALSAPQIVQLSSGTFPSFPSCNVTGSSSSANNCGDAIKSPGEGCDDGNTASGDGCSGACAVEPGWTCGGSSSSNSSGGTGGTTGGGTAGTPPPAPPATPPPTPGPAVCGNGKLDSGEQCDASAGVLCPRGNPCGGTCLCSFRGRLPSRP